MPVYSNEKVTVASNEEGASVDASAEIDRIIAGLDDWRGQVLSEIRAWILDVEPAIVEECKWKKPTNPAGVPVWSCEGMICTGEFYRAKVKLTFAHGAQLPDPARLFNASLEGNARRAIDIAEGETIDAEAFRTLIRAAVARNRKGKV